MDGENNVVPKEEPLLSDSDVNNKEKQSARCLLRERFLRIISSAVGKECSFHMHSNTNVKGIYKGSDIEFENLLVEKLETPYAEIAHSMIRSSDVNYMVFSNFFNTNI